MEELPDEEIGSRRQRVRKMREKLIPRTETQEHESLVRFVYANLAIEDPSITLQEVREVLSRDDAER
jgi:hypothetical protein